MKAWLFALALCANAAAQEYDAATVFGKLQAAYPFIQIASAQMQAPQTVQRGLRYGSGQLALDLYLPAAAPGQRSGVVLLVHGGGWRSGNREEFAPMAARLARAGYAAATASYRLSGEALYPAAVDDVKAALGWLRANADRFDIDAQRIAIAGGSAGGQIASLVGVTSQGVGAIINIDGLSDFTSPEALKYEDDPAKHPSAAGAWFGGSYAEQSQRWHEASPTFYVGPATPPMLFIGSGQARFSAGRSGMMEKLRNAGVATELVLLPETPHAFWMFDPWLAPTVEAIVRFLERSRGHPCPPDAVTAH
ncbi:MAG: alpha/beta hydrolase [Pseudomonadota bacterium]